MERQIAFDKLAREDRMVRMRAREVAESKISQGLPPCWMRRLTIGREPRPALATKASIALPTWTIRARSKSAGRKTISLLAWPAFVVLPFWRLLFDGSLFRSVRSLLRQWQYSRSETSFSSYSPSSLRRTIHPVQFQTILRDCCRREPTRSSPWSASGRGFRRPPHG